MFAGRIAVLLRCEPVDLPFRQPHPFCNSLDRVHTIEPFFLKPSNFGERIGYVRLPSRPPDHQRDFTPDGATLFQLGSNRTGGSAQELFMNFGQLACQDNRSITQDCRHVAQAFEDAMRALVTDNRCQLGREFLKHAPPSRHFCRNEANEPELVRRQARCRQRGQYSRWARYRHNRKSTLNGGGYDAISGIRHERRSGVANQRYGLAARKRFNQFLAAGCFVVLVIADERLANFEMIQQLARLPRIFARNQRHFLPQNTKGPLSDIFQISNWGRDQVQGGGQDNKKCIVEMLPEHQVVEEAPLYVRWSPDRTNYALELKLELVSKIAHEITQAERMGVEVGGVMIGVFLQGDSPTLRIDEIEIIRHNPEDGAIYMLAPGQYERFAQVRQTARNRGKTAVGFFRTHLRPGPLRPSLADRTWLADEFKQPVYAMLVIQAREPHTAAFFLATQGQLSVHPSVREFRFNEAEFKGLPEILADARGEGRESVGARVLKTGSSSRVRVVLIVVVAVVALWALFWAGSRWLMPGSGVNLAITAKDHALEITWNHNARQITRATGAVLQITDGSSHKEVRLGPDELKLGSVEYQRATQNVQVLMTLSMPGAASPVQSAEWPRQTARPSAPPQ